MQYPWAEHPVGDRSLKSPCLDTAPINMNYPPGSTCRFCNRENPETASLNKMLCRGTKVWLQCKGSWIQTLLHCKVWLSTKLEQGGLEPLIAQKEITCTRPVQDDSEEGMSGQAGPDTLASGVGNDSSWSCQCVLQLSGKAEERL